MTERFDKRDKIVLNHLRENCDEIVSQIELLDIIAAAVRHNTPRHVTATTASVARLRKQGYDIKTIRGEGYMVECS